MKRAFFTVLCLVTAVSCSKELNYEHAYVTKSGEKYLIEMRGRRRLMAHDPISAIRAETYDEKLTIELPRLNGSIDGSEIPVNPGRLSYTGRVEITNGKMKVALNYDGSDNRALPWNGEYTLVQNNGSETK